MTVGASRTYGSIYKITPTGVFTLLLAFTGHDGSHPYAPLLQAAGGDFYGTTFDGGGLGYDTFLTAIVPTGASSGYITVSTPTSVIKSDKPFLVTP